MDNKYILLFKKEGSDTVVNSFTRWAIVCAHVPFKAGGKTKDVAKRSWYDEHGEDAYVPEDLMFEAYDAEFEFAYVGRELASNPFDLGLAYATIKSFKEWLTTDGSVMSIYSPYASIGRKGCYLLEMNNEECCVQTVQQGSNVYNENVLTFRAKFRVTNPVTDITLSSSSSS